jgi:uncharacterized membrane protein YjgN (DUF898 family)
MTGSGWAYAARATLWGLLAIVTLGIAMPWRAAALERYKMQHSWYGDLQGKFEGRGWEFFKEIWWLWILTPIALIIFPLLPFLYAHYKAVEWRWWLSGIRMGGVRVESTLDPGALQGLYWKVIGWSMLFSTAFGIVMGGAITLFVQWSEAAGPDSLMQTPAMIAVMVVGYLVFALAIGIVVRLYLSRDLWVKVLATTKLFGLESAANVAARGDLASALGEGFADGLDVGGF